MGEEAQMSGRNKTKEYPRRNRSDYCQWKDNEKVESTRNKNGINRVINLKTRGILHSKAIAESTKYEKGSAKLSCLLELMRGLFFSAWSVPLSARPVAYCRMFRPGPSSF